MERLFDPGNDLRLRYAAPLSIDTLSPELSRQFQAIERTYNVQIYYGKRPFRGIYHEVLLINVADIVETELNDFKYYLWDKFGLDCGQYEFDPEFRRFVNLADVCGSLSSHCRNRRAARVVSPRMDGHAARAGRADERSP